MRLQSRLHRILVYSCIFGLAISTLSCEENLPAYKDPRDVFEGTLACNYVCNQIENAFKVYLIVKNTYDETLEARATLSGSVVITWDSDPTFRRTFTLAPAQLIYARRYDAGSGVLQLDAGDTVRFGLSWTFFSDDGRDLRRLVTFKSDPTCPRRFISAELVHFTVEASVDMFPRTETVVPKTLQYKFEFVREYVDPRNC